MKNIICILFTGLMFNNGFSQNDISNNIEIIKKNIYKDYKGMFKEPKGALKYPFVTPGSDQYSEELWDWDSWFTDIALRQIVTNNPESKIDITRYEQGCVLNFLSYGGMNGWIPVLIEPANESREQMLNDRNVFERNMHKPVLAQHAAFIVQQNNGNAEWLRENFYYLQAFENAYLNYYRHKPTGLLYWQNDGGIGVDNDPCTFYRPDASSGSILLNCFMYKELLATAYIARCLNQAEIATIYEKEADDLKAAIRKNCWDPKDGFYYSVDFNLTEIKKPTGAWQLHNGGPRKWDCLIQRIGVWSGFCAM